MRLDAVRNLYNTCLREALRRLDLMRQSKAYQAARALPKGKDRTEAFKDVRDRYRFYEYSLHSFAVQTKNACWIGGHLDVPVCQKIATRSFNAFEHTLTAGAGRGSKDMAGSPASKVKATLPAFAGGMAMSCGANWIWCRGST